MEIHSAVDGVRSISVPSHPEYHWLLSSSVLISLAREVPVKQPDMRDKFTTLYTCGWYIRARRGGILRGARTEETSLT